MIHRQTDTVCSSHMHTDTHIPPSEEVMCKVTASPCGNAWEL